MVNKAGNTANTSCGRVGRSGNACFHTFRLVLTDQRTNGQTDKGSYRVACPQLKISNSCIISTEKLAWPSKRSLHQLIHSINHLFYHKWHSFIKKTFSHKKHSFIKLIYSKRTHRWPTWPCSCCFDILIPHHIFVGEIQKWPHANKYSIKFFKKVSTCSLKLLHQCSLKHWTGVSSFLHIKQILRQHSKFFLHSLTTFIKKRRVSSDDNYC